MSVIPPVIEIFEFDTTQVASPIGNRHIEGGSFAFKQRVALGYSQYSGPGTSGNLIFQDIKFNVAAPVSHIASRVSAIIIRMATSGSQISEMKLYLSNGSALSGSRDVGLDAAIMQYAVSGVWQPNSVLPSGITNQLPYLVPASPNVFRQDGANVIDGNQDIDVSQFIYMNLIVPQGFPLGSYGIIGSGLLRPALIFDYV